MKAIIICGPAASGKTTVARAIARRLGLPQFDGGDALKEIARRRGYHPSGVDWWDTRRGIRFLMERKADPKFDREADKIMLARIAKGNVVVTSWTMPWISKKGFKVWLDANINERARRMAKRDGSTLKRARAAILVRDRENKSLYKKMYKIELGKDMRPFDLIVEATNLSPKEVSDIVIKNMGGR